MRPADHRDSIDTQELASKGFRSLAGEKFVRHDRLGVSARIEEVLQASPYLALRSLRCEFDGTSVILSGRVPTFYTKQVAFTLVERLGLGAEIVDQIEVAPPKPRKPRPR